MGFTPTVFFNSQCPHDLRVNPNRTNDLTSSAPCRSIPVVAGYGGCQQGQNRDRCRNGLLLIWLVTGIGAAGMVLINGYAGDNETPTGPLPRQPRRKKRSKEDQGLPADHDLAELAKFYLEQARSLWPELAETGLITEISDQVIAEMVEDFKQRHRTGRVDPARLSALIKRGTKLAALYARYSDDNSQTKSNVDQTRGILRKAKDQGRFVCWEYVFADYARSAVYGVRQGYSSLLKVVKHKDHAIKTIYIDEFRRASRDDREWWIFAGICKNLGIGLYGASDGFHLDDETWEEKLKLFNLAVGMETKLKRQTVRRGMRGAAQRFTCRGKLSLGFTRQVVRDEAERVARRSDGRPYYEPCIDPITRVDRERLFTLFLDEGLSLYKITQQFNAMKVDGWDGWTESGLKGLLWEPDGIGVFISNRTRKELNHETGEWVKKVNPHSEWDVIYKKELAIVPIPRWAAARRKLAYLKALSPRTGRKLSRNEKCATTLFSGTLFCGYCGHEVVLSKSAGDYKSMYCPNGPAVRHGCLLTSHKSTRIIESCLLAYIKDSLFTETTIDGLFAKAEGYLGQETARPRQDVAPLRNDLRQIEKEIDALFKRLERKGNGDDALQEAYDKRISQRTREAKKLRKQVRDLEVDNRMPPPPLDRLRVSAYVENLRELLNLEISAAAEAIRLLTGRITIRQENIPGKSRGTRWIATFQPNLLALLRKMAKDRSYPDSVTLEYLSSRIWIEPIEVCVVIDEIPNYVRLAPDMLALAEQGTSTSSIAAAYGVTHEFVRQALGFARTGQRQKWKKKGKKTGTGPKSVFKTIVPDVVRLRNQKYTVARIREWLAENKGLKVGYATVRHAWDFAHQQDISQAVAAGERPFRGSYSHLGSEAYDQIHNLLLSGISSAEVARQVGCGTSTVNRVKKQFVVDGLLPPKLPKAPPKQPKRQRGRSPAEIKDEVKQLRDEKGMTFDQIRRQLRASFTTVTKAYDLAHPELVEQSRLSGDPVRRSPNARLGPRKEAIVRQMLSDSERICKIMATVGCTRHTVMRIRRMT